MSEEELHELLDRAAEAESEMAAFKILFDGGMPALEARDTATLMWLADRYGGDPV